MAISRPNLLALMLALNRDTPFSIGGRQLHYHLTLVQTRIEIMKRLAEVRNIPLKYMFREGQLAFCQPLGHMLARYVKSICIIIDDITLDRCAHGA